MNKSIIYKNIKIFVLFILITTLLLSVFTVDSSASKSNEKIEQHFQFDIEGNLTTYISPDGSKIRYKYNDKGLPVEIKSPDDNVRYGYDRSGNRIWMENKIGRTEYKYDAFNRLSEITFKYSPKRTIRYDYDPWSRISDVIIIQNDKEIYHLEYKYNILGNIKSISNGKEKIEYDYNPEKGEVIRHLPNGIKSVFSYTPLGELKLLRHVNPLNRLIASYQYKYNHSGEVTRVVEKTSAGIRITKYKWDSRGHLNALKLPNGSTLRYKYDAMGNLLSVTMANKSIKYEYDGFGRLRKAGKTRYEWDKNGNLIFQTGERGQTVFNYDSVGLPSSITTPDITVQYRYDGDGSIIARKVGEKVTLYLPNPLAPPGLALAEFDKSGSLNNTYLYGNGLVGQRDRRGKMSYFLEDGFNSVRFVTGSQGRITSQIDYSPFGEPKLIKGKRLPEISNPGMRYLSRANISLSRGRLYKPHIGFTSPVSVPTHIDFSRNKNRHYRKAWDLIEQNQRLSMPPQDKIKEVESYWTEGRYRNEDPYYYSFINKLPDSPDLLYLYHRMRAGAAEAIWGLGMYGTTLGRITSGVPVLGLSLNYIGGRIRHMAVDEIRTYVPQMGYVATPLEALNKRIDPVDNIVGTLINLNSYSKIGLDLFTKDYSRALSGIVEKVASDRVFNYTKSIIDRHTRVNRLSKSIIESEGLNSIQIPSASISYLSDNKTSKIGDITNTILLIDVPGVGWTGTKREGDWGKLLSVDTETVYIKHKGSKLSWDKWDTSSYDHVIVLADSKRESLDKFLLNFIEGYEKDNKSVHIIIDKNITLTRHLTLGKKSEDIWAANIVDYILEKTDDSYFKMLAMHSNGTIIPKYMKNTDKLDYAAIASPRGELGLELARMQPDMPIDIITGLSDAPSLRLPGSKGELLRNNKNLRIIELQEGQFLDFWKWGETHGKLQNVEHTGKWKIMGGKETQYSQASLGKLLGTAISKAKKDKTKPALGAKDSRFNGKMDRKKIIAARTDIEHFSSVTKLLTDTLETWGAINKSTPQGERILKQTKWHKTMRELYKLSKALDDDIRDYNNKKYVLLKSNTLEVLYVVASEQMVDIIKKYIAIKKTAESSAFPTFGVEEFIHAAGRNIRDGRTDINTIELYLDGLVGLTWASAAYLQASAVGADVTTSRRAATTAQNLGIFLSKMMRDKSRNHFNVAWKWLSGDVLKFASLYDGIQRSNVVRNIEIQSPEEFFGGDRKSMGLDKWTWNKLENAYVRFQSDQEKIHKTSPKKIRNVIDHNQMDKKERERRDDRRLVLKDKKGLSEKLCDDSGKNCAVFDSQKHLFFLPPKDPPPVPVVGNDDDSVPPPLPGSVFNDPFKSVEAKLGGIKLDATAEFTGDLGNIAGAVYDPYRQVLVFIGEEDISLPSINASDLAVAMMLVFNPLTRDPQFSLDPADPRNPRGKWLKAVYIPQQIIANTDFGKTLFEADWLLKQYSFGVTIDDDGKMHERKSSVTGYKSAKDFSLETDRQTEEKERWSRYWIVSDEMRIRRSGNSIYFDKAKMLVKTKKQIPDPASPTGLRDVEIKDPVSTKFADMFTRYYDEIAKESPEFERVRQLAKVVALAKWMKKEKIPFDRNWVNEYANKHVDNIGKITALSARWESRKKIPYQESNRRGIQTITKTLYLFGGVDLTVKPKYVADNGTAQSLQKSVMTKLREEAAGPVFSVKYKGRDLVAVVVPVTKGGQAMWEQPSVKTAKDVDYRFNSRGDVVGSSDKFGNRAEYTYDSRNKLKTVKIDTNQGWTTFAQRDNQGTTWIFTNLKGNKLRYKYDKSGRLMEVSLDGKRLASYDYDAERKVVSISYPEHEETIIYTEKGLIRGYTLKNKNDEKQDKVTFNYDSSNKLIGISGADIGKTDIYYSKDGSLPLTVKTSQGDIHYTYDSKNRIKDITISGNRSIHYSYDGEGVNRIVLRYGSRTSEIQVDKKNRFVKAKNLRGEITEYRYSKKDWIASVSNSNGYKAQYDTEGRLSKELLPDGRLIEYDLEKKFIKEQELYDLTVTVHASSAVVTNIATRSRLSEILKSRIQDSIGAVRESPSNMVLDIYAADNGKVYAYIVDHSGNVHKFNSTDGDELRTALNNVINTSRGPLSQKNVITPFKKLRTKLLSLSHPKEITFSDGISVKIKPNLIIRYNESIYKIANLERIHDLMENFTVFVASKKEDWEGAETDAIEIAQKIGKIPPISKDNIAFIVGLPKKDITPQEESLWNNRIEKLRKIVGEKNVLYNPSKKEFIFKLNNTDKEVIAIHLIHTRIRGEEGIVMDDDIFNSKDIQNVEDLSNIKFLLSISCKLALLENGKLEAAFREKGVGIVNVSSHLAPTDINGKRIDELIKILEMENIEVLKIYPYQLMDILDQRLKFEGRKSINLGKVDLRRNYLFFSLFEESACDYNNYSKIAISLGMIQEERFGNIQSEKWVRQNRIDKDEIRNRLTRNKAACRRSSEILKNEAFKAFG